MSEARRVSREACKGQARLQMRPLLAKPRHWNFLKGCKEPLLVAVGVTWSDFEHLAVCRVEGGKAAGRAPTQDTEA